MSIRHARATATARKATLERLGSPELRDIARFLAIHARAEERGHSVIYYGRRGSGYFRPDYDPVVPSFRGEVATRYDDGWDNAIVFERQG